jgi:hypothetical protein
MPRRESRWRGSRSVNWLVWADVLNKLALPVGGMIGLYLAWLRVEAANRQAEAQIRQADASTRQAELNRRRQEADLFNQAVGQLQSERLEVKLGAIYALPLLQIRPNTRARSYGCFHSTFAITPSDGDSTKNHLRTLVKFLLYWAAIRRNCYDNSTNFPRASWR